MQCAFFSSGLSHCEIYLLNVNFNLEWLNFFVCPKSKDRIYPILFPKYIPKKNVNIAQSGDISIQLMKRIFLD